MKTKPIGEKILIKRLESVEKTAGGIVLPDSAKEKPKEGTVIALGDGKLLDNGDRSKFQVKKGDTVVFSSYAGTEITIDDDEYLLMSEDDILAIID
jgi:chaperonin GroES